MAANVAAVMVISTQVGPVGAPAVRQILVRERRHDDQKSLEPHADHDTDEAITVPVIVRSFLIARSGNGIRKLQKTIVQKSGE